MFGTTLHPMLFPKIGPLLPPDFHWQSIKKQSRCLPTFEIRVENKQGGEKAKSVEVVEWDES